MVFANVRVDPCEYFFFTIEEDHIFVDHEEAVVLR